MGQGKGADTFGPIGPWLVTTDEITNPQTLDVWLDVNGERRQSSNTRNMIFSCARLVSYVSNYMTLLPGDIITTGTPAGVALGMKPTQAWLKPGDVVTLGIKGLGEQRQKVISTRGNREPPCCALPTWYVRRKNSVVAIGSKSGSRG